MKAHILSLAPLDLLSFQSYRERIRINPLAVLRQAELIGAEMKQLLATILLGAGNVVAITLLKHLESRQVESLLAVIASACVGIILTKAGEYLLLELPLRFRPLRRLLDPRAALEGRWLEHIPGLPGNPYTVLTISYNAESKSYCMHGRNYDINRNELRTFDSQHVSISSSLNQVLYTYTAHQSLENQSDAAGVCCMDFRSSNSGKLDSGQGFFFNRDPQATKFSFSFKRVAGRDAESDQSIIDRMTPAPALPIAVHQ
ncbi:hypothetical protein [Candidatus Accumulibacter phosphatis]